MAMNIILWFLLTSDGWLRKKHLLMVEITPYYYEHGVCLEDHDGTSAHLYTILISKQTYLRPFNTNKDRIKENEIKIMGI